MPLNFDNTAASSTKQKKEERIAANILDILEQIGEDTKREGLLSTPQRVAKSYSEMLAGYDVNLEEIFNAQFFEKPINNNMIILQDIEYKSICEHHILPVVGVANIAYIPNQSILGISKFVRIVNAYAQRLQMQERMTAEICSIIFNKLKAQGVAVHLKAQHYCMIMRGVKQTAQMHTYHFEGVFQQEEYKNQFINSISK